MKSFTPSKNSWPKPSQYRKATKANGSETAYLGCPNCGGLVSLYHHHINKGEVHPKLSCPHAHCNFEGNVKLENF